MKKGWFEVSQKGLAQLQGPRPKSNIIRELVQNGFDENITTCTVQMKKEGMYVHITVTDDSPEGFRDLSHAFTLFDYTYKRADTKKRGRYNLGEKLAISSCKKAWVKTTKGTVFFNGDGTRSQNGRKAHKTDKGTVVYLLVKMTREEMDEALKMAKSLLPPEDIQYSVQDELVPYRKPFKVLSSVYLPTEVYDGTVGAMRRTWQFADVHLHEPREGEVASLYEMGIPIQETGDTYCYDVMQKCPMTMDRDAVIPSLLLDLRVAVLDRMADQIDKDHVSKEWVREATRASDLSGKALIAVADARWGKNRFVADLSDSRSIDEARAHGLTQVQGGEMDKREWENFRRAGAIPTSSSQFPTKFVGYTAIDEKLWTWQMRLVAEYAKLIARTTLDKGIEVRIIHSEADAEASYRPTNGEDRLGRLTLNRNKLSQKWWSSGISEEVTDLLIHELGHEGGNHTEHGYHQTLTKIAAKLVMALNKQCRLLDALAKTAREGGVDE